MSSGAGGHGDSSNNGQGHFEGRLRSGPSRIRSFIRFVNFTERRVDVIWLNHEGFGIRYRTLEPRQAIDVNTFVGHPWIFRDSVTGDRLHVQLREVYEPVAWNSDPESPRRRQVYITNQLYSLRDRCIQEVKRLVPPDRIHLLEVPREISRDLKTQSRDLPVVSLYDQAARSIVTNRVGPNPGSVQRGFLPSVSPAYNTGLHALSGNSLAAISPSLIVVSRPSAGQSASPSSVAGSSGLGSDARSTSGPSLRPNPHPSANPQRTADTDPTPGTSSVVLPRAHSLGLNLRHRAEHISDMANNNNNNELAVDRNCNNNNNANVANQNRNPAPNALGHPVAVQALPPPARVPAPEEQPSGSRISLVDSSSSSTEVPGASGQASAQPIPGPSGISGFRQSAPTMDLPVTSVSREQGFYSCEEEIADSVDMESGPEVETIILPVPSSRLPPSVGRTVLDGLSFPPLHAVAPERVQRCIAVGTSPLAGLPQNGQTGNSTCSLNGQHPASEQMDDESAILPYTDNLSPNKREGVTGERDEPVVNGEADYSTGNKDASSEPSTSSHTRDDRHFLPLKKRRK